MERQAKDGTFYQQVGQDEWTPVTRAAKDGTVYKKIGVDAWSPLEIKDEQSPGKIESFSRGAAQGATLGFADEISGATEALWNKANGDPLEFGKLYQRYRDESRANFKSAQDTNPVSYGAGEIGAGLATMLVPGLNAAKGAKAATTIAKAAGYGAAAGTGYSEGETVGEIATDAITGAALGAATAAAAPYVGKGLSKAGEKAKGSAERFAARAMGAERATVKKLGQDRIKEIGRYALDEGILSPLASTDDLIERNTASKKAAMSARKAAYDQIDNAGASTFNPGMVAQEVEKNVIGNSNRAHLDTQDLIKKLDPEIQNILSRGQGNISMAEAQDLVSKLGKRAKFDSSRSNETNEMMKTIYRTVREEINNAAESGSKSVNLGDIVKDANRKFSIGKDAETLLSNKNAREQGNKLMGITDWSLLGGGGAAAVVTGGASVVPAVAALGVKKGLEKYGSQNAALLLDKTGKVLSRAPRAMESVARNPVLLEQSAVSPIRPQISGAIQNVAGLSDGEKPTKGPQKWMNDGIDLITESDNSIDRRILEKLKETKNGQKILIEASSAKNPKAMDRILKQIRTSYMNGGE